MEPLSTKPAVQRLSAIVLWRSTSTPSVSRPRREGRTSRTHSGAPCCAIAGPPGAAYSWSPNLLGCPSRLLNRSNSSRASGHRSRVPHCAPVRAFPACMAGGTMPASIRLLRRGGGGVTQPKCGAPTETVGRCKRPADVGSGQCFQHQGAWTAKARAQRKKKEAAAKMQELRKKKWSWW